MGKILTLDLSTTSTGWALFDSKTKKLKEYGLIKPTGIKGVSKMRYPESAMWKIKVVSSKVADLIKDKKPDQIICEEINRGKNRIGQKVLDSLHFFVLDEIQKIDEKLIKNFKYIDSDGNQGWRTKLELRLSDEDKKHNKKLRTKEAKKNKINAKVLAERFVNKKYKKAFDVRKNPQEADLVDAIALGSAFLTKKSLTK